MKKFTLCVVALTSSTALHAQDTFRYAKFVCTDERSAGQTTTITLTPSSSMCDLGPDGIAMVYGVERYCFRVVEETEFESGSFVTRVSGLDCTRENYNDGDWALGCSSLSRVPPFSIVIANDQKFNAATLRRPRNNSNDGVGAVVYSGSCSQ